MKALAGTPPKVFVFENAPDLKALSEEKSFIGSREADLNINGKMKRVVVFYRVPIENLKLENIDDSERIAASKAAKKGLAHFMALLRQYGIPKEQAEKLVSVSVIGDELLKDVSALCPTAFKNQALQMLRVPEIRSTKHNNSHVQSAKKIAEQIRQEVKEIRKSNAEAMSGSDGRDPTQKLKSTDDLPPKIQEYGTPSATTGANSLNQAQPKPEQGTAAGAWKTAKFSGKAQSTEAPLPIAQERWTPSVATTGANSLNQAQPKPDQDTAPGALKISTSSDEASSDSGLTNKTRVDKPLPPLPPLPSTESARPKKPLPPIPQQ